MGGGVHPPLSVVLTWPTPNYVDPVTRGWEVPIMCMVLFAIALIVVLARLWARLVLQHNAGLDDLFIVFSMIPLIGLTVSTCLAERLYGFDRHVWDLTPELAIQSRKSTLAMDSFYVASTGLTKISILLFYRRLADGTISPTFRISVLTSIAFVAAYIIVFIVTPLLGCRPLNAFWRSVTIAWLETHVEGVDWVCFNEGASDLAASVISMIQDFLACGMPILLFWKLRLPRRQKIALGAIFGVGFFLCITAIIRCIYITRIFFETYDVTWVAYEAWAWTSVEADVAVICASAPALKAFFKQYFQGSNFGSAISYSLRRNGYRRNAYGTGKSRDNALGITSSTSGAHSFMRSDKEMPDIEIGRIEVTQEVDIMEELSPEGSFRERCSSEERRGHGLPAAYLGDGRKNDIHDTTWLDIGPSSEGPPGNQYDRQSRK